MLVKLIETIFKKSGLTQYQFAKKLGVPIQTVQHWLGVTKQGKASKQKGFRLDLLCKLKGESGLTWEKFGTLLEQEFGED